MFANLIFTETTPMPDWPRQFITWLKRWNILLLIIAVIGTIVIFDQVLMPLIVHSRQTIRMPNVVGMPQEQAIALLQQYGLKVHEVRQQYDSTQPAGRIVLQSPYPGATVRQGRRVYLVVSRGDETTRVPMLVGMSLRDAQLALLREGLQLGQVQAIVCDSAFVRGVIEQFPAAGIVVRVGSNVHLTICQDTVSLVTVPNLVFRSQDDAQRLIEESKLQLGDVILQHDETFTPGTVLRQEPAAGSRVPAQTVIRIWVSSNL